MGVTIGALPQTPQGNPVPLTLTTLSLRDSWEKKWDITLSRREAEMGFGDEIPKRGMGWQPHGNSRSPYREAIKKSKNQGAKRS